MNELLEFLTFFSPAIIGLTVHYKGNPKLGFALTGLGIIAYLILTEMNRLLGM